MQKYSLFKLNPNKNLVYLIDSFYLLTILMEIINKIYRTRYIYDAGAYNYILQTPSDSKKMINDMILMCQQDKSTERSYSTFATAFKEGYRQSAKKLSLKERKSLLSNCRKLLLQIRLKRYVFRKLTQDNIPVFVAMPIELENGEKLFRHNAIIYYCYLYRR